MTAQKIIYEPHPVTPERKAELRAQGYTILDAVFDPNPQPAKAKAEKPAKPDENKPEATAFDADAAKAYLKDKGVKFTANIGKAKLQALYEANLPEKPNDDAETEPEDEEGTE